MGDFQTTTHPKARKARQCPECEEVIQPGDRYARIAGSYDGDFISAIQCERCCVFGDRYLKSLDLCTYLNWDEKTYQFGSLLDEAAEHLGLFRAEDRNEQTWGQRRDAMMAMFDAHDAAEREEQRRDREQAKAAKERAVLQARDLGHEVGQRYRGMSEPLPSPALTTEGA